MTVVPAFYSGIYRACHIAEVRLSICTVRNSRRRSLTANGGGTEFANRGKSRNIGPKHRLIQNLAFNQDDIERLAAAYEEALLALHISDRDDPINKVIAQRIIEGARAGVRDPIALCKMAVKDLMVP